MLLPLYKNKKNIVTFAISVATAAPKTPILNVYIKIGSKIIFIIIPMALILKASLLFPKLPKSLVNSKLKNAKNSMGALYAK